MTNNQLNEKRQSVKSAITTHKQTMIDSVMAYDELTDSSKAKIAKYINKTRFRDMNEYSFWKLIERKDGKFDISWMNALIDTFEIEEYLKMEAFCETYRRYEDSKTVKFDGDVVITDPCYIMNPCNNIVIPEPNWMDFISMPVCVVEIDSKGNERKRYDWPKDEDYPDAREKTLEDVSKDKVAISQFKLECACGKKPMFSPTFASEKKAYFDARDEYYRTPTEDWDRCNGGYDMSALGFKKWISRETLCGDWRCAVVNTDSSCEIGEFCADTGMVAVLALDEIRDYHPEFADKVEADSRVALVKNFKGTIQYIVNENPESKYTPYIATIVGHGIDKLTGKPINFETVQNGF